MPLQAVLEPVFMVAASDTVPLVWVAAVIGPLAAVVTLSADGGADG